MWSFLLDIQNTYKQLFYDNFVTAFLFSSLFSIKKKKVENKNTIKNKKKNCPKIV